jgi:diacylglycerol kinase (ATP)
MKTLIIHNPIAGARLADDELDRTAAFLCQEGWNVLGIEQTNGPGDATTYARKAVAEGCSAVFVAGGDGTIAQAVDGLVNTDTALAVLPGGTGNVLARQLNLPLPGGLHQHPLAESAQLALQGLIRRVDVGRVHPRDSETPARHFLCWSGVGFDAEVNRTVNLDQGRKQRLGVGAATITAFGALRTYAGTAAIVRVDGHRVSRRLILLEASNIQLYGVFFRMAPRAVLDDGWLDIYCFQGTGPLRTLLHVLRLALNRHIQDPKVDSYRARRVEVRTYRPLPVHVDGDYFGQTPVVMEIVPRAVKLMVPRSAPSSLFVDGTGMLQPETTWEWMWRMAKDAQVAIKERSGLA